MTTTYTYSIANDFPNAAFKSNTLRNEIIAAGIGTNLSHIESLGDIVSIIFTVALTVGEKTILDNIVGGHNEAEGEGITGSMLFKNIVIEQPTSSENFLMFFTDVELFTTRIVGSVVGSSSPSVTWTLKYDPNRNGTGTEILSGGFITSGTTDIASFTSATIPTSSFVWLETSAKNGTIDEFGISYFT